jgi:hypothetical protein
MVWKKVARWAHHAGAAWDDEMILGNTPSRYGAVATSLHWLIAALLLL